MTSASDRNKWALLIGIDQYPYVSKLTGCVNDVDAMRQVLTGPFGFPEEHVTILKDDQATQEGIREAMKALVERVGNGDVVVFHYSGHGSQMTDLEGDEPDGLDETIVPYDSGRNPHPNRDIKDDEIYLWLKELTDKTSNITLIFDCCHSGTITRDDSFGDAVRWVEPDLRLPEDLPPSPIPSGAWSSLDGGRDIGPSGWLPLGERFVLLAGCGRDEKSYEYQEPGGLRHGAMTYFLLDELRRVETGTTYRDVFETVAARVSARYQTQHPQLEGARDREVFGVRWIEPMKFVPVLRRDGTRVVLGGGAVCGLTSGSLWGIHPAKTKTVEPGEEPLGVVSISSVGAVTSEGELVREAQPGAVKNGMRAVEESRVLETRMPVQVVAGSSRHSQALRDAIAASKLLKLVGPGEYARARAYLLEPRTWVAENAPVPTLGELREETWAVVGESGDLLMPVHLRSEPGVIELLLENLEKRALYKVVLDLQNEGSSFKGKVEAELFRWTGGGLVKPEVGPDNLPLFYEGDFLGLKVANRSAQPLFIYALDLGLTGRISLVYPLTGTEDSLLPGRTLEVGELDLYIPDEYPFVIPKPGERDLDGYETLKIIATTHKADFDPLLQSGVRGDCRTLSLTKLLDDLDNMRDALRDTRLRNQNDGPEDWTAVEKSFRLRRRWESRFAVGGRGI
jgi:Caspase domain